MHAQLERLLAPGLRWLDRERFEQELPPQRRRDDDDGGCDDGDGDDDDDDAAAERRDDDQGGVLEPCDRRARRKRFSTRQGLIASDNLETLSVGVHPLVGEIRGQRTRRALAFAELCLVGRDGRRRRNALVVGSAHLECGDLEMRRAMRAWLRDTGGRLTPLCERGAAACAGKRYVDAALVAGDFNLNLATELEPSGCTRDIQLLWPASGCETHGWLWGSWHGYHNPNRKFVGRGRIIDGVLAFAHSAVYPLSCELLTVPKLADPEDHAECARKLQNFPADHFPALTKCGLDLSDTRAAGDAAWCPAKCACSLCKRT